MAHTDLIDQIAQRTERLLLRHQQAQHELAALTEQVRALSLERDLLKSRLSAARARVDALIDRMAANPSACEPTA